jgi:RHS repeat-associated protein
MSDVQRSHYTTRPLRRAHTAMDNQPLHYLQHQPPPCQIAYSSIQSASKPIKSGVGSYQLCSVWRFYGGANIETAVTQPDGNTVRYKFNARGMPTEIIDALGQSTKNLYDPKQRLVKTIDPLGRESKYEYDTVGNRTASIDPLGRRVETAYDAVLNKPTAYTQYLLGVPSVQGGVNLSYTPVARSMTYDAKGNVTAMLDPLGHSSQIAYSASGQISEVVLPAKVAASAVPVINGGIVGVLAKTSRKLSLSYNNAGDIALLADAQGNETRFETDSLGRTVAITDPLGYTSQTQYNALDQLTQSTNALGQTSSLSYDSAARLTGVVNPAGVTIEGYAYDNNGRLNRVTDAANQSSTVVYDSSSRPISFTDRKGQVTTITYDARGDISQLNKPGQSIGYQYDAIGRLTEVRDATTVSTQHYDSVGRLTQIDTTTAAGTHRLLYDYDSLDRVTKRTLSGTGITAPETTTYEWDLADRLVSHATTVGEQLHSTRYDYDAAGRLAARKVQAGASTDLITQRYGYDSAERLVQIKYIRAEGTAQEQLIEQIDYQYDAAGRRTAKTALNNNGIGAGETPMTASYDAANRMTAITLTLGTITKTYALNYDFNGNLTQKQNTTDLSDKATYTWDANDRLSQINQPGLSAAYSYDVFGRRIQSFITPVGQTPTTVQYLYEGSQALGEIRDGKLSHRLLTGLQLDEAIARIAINGSGQKDTANSRIYLSDGLNSVIAQLSDDAATAGQIQNSYGYSPYGESVTVGPDASANPIQYTARENDKTGLNFYRARYYDPVLKRFISEDPAGLAAGLNGYQYANAAPTMFTDPTGLQVPGTWNTIFRNVPSPNWNLPNPIGATGQAAGATGDFLRNYNDMRNANTIGADKYFHCKANCEASRRGSTGNATACMISDTREWFDQTIKGDPASASEADQVANRYGRNQSSPFNSCDITCGGFRPNGLNPRY